MLEPIAYVTFDDHALVLLRLPNGAPLQFAWYVGSGASNSVAVWRFLGLTLARVTAGDA